MALHWEWLGQDDPLQQGALATRRSRTPRPARAGRLFIANLDLPKRFRRGAPLNHYDRSSFYIGTEQRCTDHSALPAKAQAA